MCIAFFNFIKILFVTRHIFLFSFCSIQTYFILLIPSVISLSFLRAFMIVTYNYIKFLRAYSGIRIIFLAVASYRVSTLQFLQLLNYLTRGETFLSLSP